MKVIRNLLQKIFNKKEKNNKESLETNTNSKLKFKINLNVIKKISPKILFKKSLLKRLVIVSAFLVVFSLVSSSTINYFILEDSVVSDFKSSASQILNQNKLYMELYYRSIDNASKFIMNDKQFIKVLSDKPLKKNKRGKINKEVDIEYIRNVVREKITEVADNILIGLINNIYFFSTEEFSDGSGGGDFSEIKLNKVRNKKWYKKISDSDKSFWTDPYDDIIVFSSGTIISYLSLIKNKDTGDKLGVLAVNLIPQTIAAELNKVKIGKKGYIIVTNENGYILSHKKIEKVGVEIDKTLKSQITKKQGFFTFDQDETKMFAVYTTSDVIGWKFIAVVPDDELSLTARKVGNVSFYIILAFILISVLISIYTSRKITLPIKKITETTKELATGNFAVKLKIKKNLKEESLDEIGALSKFFNDFIDEISTVIKNIQEDAAMLNKASVEISMTAQNLSESTTEQAASVEEMAASMEEMSATIATNANNAQNTDIIAKESAAKAQEGGDAVVQTVESMKRIVENVDTIEGIAAQTNFLALNAAIEAARAGEHGKGFAVVSEEVRDLAEKSRVAAGQIIQITQASMNIAEDAGKLVNEIVPSIGHTADLVQDIAEASKQQSLGVDQMTESIEQLNNATQGNSESASQLAMVSGELSKQAIKIKKMVEFFKV